MPSAIQYGTPSLRKKRYVTLLALFTLSMAVFLNGNWAYGLFESSEARYAEVAREMVATGDYLSPQIDYVYHFTKPPLAYWITAAGYRLFGQGEFGARFFLSIAGSLAVLFCALVYGRVRRTTGVLAGVVLMCSFEFFALAKVLTTDMFLTLLIVIEFYLWTRFEQEELAGSTFSWLSGVTAGLAFIVKGPVGLLFWGVVLVPYSIWKDRGRSLKPFLSWRFCAVFVAVALPWFIAVGLKHPGLLGYLFVHESAEAAVSSRRFHDGPWYYYIPVLLAGIFPWWVIVFSRFKRVLAPKVRLWLLWATVPVVIWSVFPSKLPTYILPCIPAWALLAAWLLDEGDFGGRAIASLMPAGVLAVAGAALHLFCKNLNGLPSVGFLAAGLVLSCALVALAGSVLGVSGKAKAAFVCSAISIMFLQLAAPYLCANMEEAMKIESGLAKKIAALRSPGEPILEYRVTIYSVPFYVRDKVAAYQNGFIRNKYIEKLPPHILVGRGALAAFFSSPDRIWIVTDKDEEQSLHSRARGLELVMRHGRHSLWVRDPQ